MYADIFTNPWQGAMLWRFQDMIQGIPKSTPYVDIICPRAMAKVNSHECLVQNDGQTQGTAIAIMDDRGGMCTDDRGILCMDTQTRGSTSMDDHGSICT